MMLAQQPIVEQLRRAGAKSAEGVIEFAGQVEAPRMVPAFFVIPTRERAEPNAYAGARDQRVSVEIGVVIVLAGAARHGQSTSEQLVDACQLAGRALTGWTHPQASAPTDYAGGELLSTKDGLVMWLMRFATRYHERKPT
ncbi:MAG: hypothetical protein K2X73_04770 [Sphingomonas sp.]|uniref:phage tail terminator protein n=1 Tax=Sphingomonas sp. TaxID=28214 RepID=UPI0025F667FE|nr:hypothetical protein [Sphingomonas sp.]MBX9881267.1 hypothetical protein [Sphingomonas sp.]